MYSTIGWVDVGTRAKLGGYIFCITVHEKIKKSEEKKWFGKMSFIAKVIP
jgi:hypothetical protein